MFTATGETSSSGQETLPTTSAARTERNWDVWREIHRLLGMCEGRGAATLFANENLVSLLVCASCLFVASILPKRIKVFHGAQLRLNRNESDTKKMEKHRQSNKKR